MNILDHDEIRKNKQNPKDLSLSNEQTENVCFLLSLSFVYLKEDVVMVYYTVYIYIILYYRTWYNYIDLLYKYPLSCTILEVDEASIYLDKEVIHVLP